ncbi:MAG: MBL fold metallo-hydrolase [Deltaproteobacteria bacterium]|nr:MBL fold metallo-hydrolase [Deltaproteobacteria bacterium]
MKTARGSLTILTDNTVPERSNAIAEHGFSAFLETGEGNFLFDTGKGKTVVHNAAILKKDLAGINKIVLSHAHGDHTGGLPDVLPAVSAKQVDVFAHPDIFADRFREKNDQRTYGGIPFIKGYLEKMGARFVFNNEYREIEEGVFLTGEVPRETSFEGGDMGNRYVIREGKVEPDVILDDQSLVIHVEKGILIVLGCAHAGIVNVINHAIKMSGVDEIYGIIGGTHIGLSGDAQRDKTIEALKNYKIEHLIPAHCTGAEAMCLMRNAFGNIFQFSHVGMTFHF